MCLGEQFSSLSPQGWLLQARQGVWLPKQLWPDAVQDFSQNGEQQWYSSGRLRSAEAGAGLVTVTHRAGGIAGVPQGLLWVPRGACLLSFLCLQAFCLQPRKGG